MVEYGPMKKPLTVRIVEALVDHRQKILLAYLAVAGCVLLYLTCDLLKFTYFSVHIPDGFQSVFGIVGNGCDNANPLPLIEVVKRQSASKEILADFVHEWQGIMIAIPLMSLGLLNREGFVPCFLKTWKRGVHWAIWIISCAVVVGAVCFAAIASIQYLISSPESFPSNQLVCKTLRTDLAASLELVLARRRTLTICSIIHLVTVIGTAILALTIPALRILWAPRHASCVRNEPSSMVCAGN